MTTTILKTSRNSHGDNNSNKHVLNFGVVCNRQPRVFMARERKNSKRWKTSKRQHVCDEGRGNTRAQGAEATGITCAHKYETQLCSIGFCSEEARPKSEHSLQLCTRCNSASAAGLAAVVLNRIEAASTGGILEKGNHLRLAVCVRRWILRFGFVRCSRPCRCRVRKL